MPSKDLEETGCDECTLQHRRDTQVAPDPDSEFGGAEARKELEKSLLLKLDARMSILIVIYILNYVSCTSSKGLETLTPRRWIGTMRREWKPRVGIVGAEPHTSAARLRGFEEDLGLVGNQFGTVLSILYVGYITMQVPSYVSCLRSWPNIY
jgi:hypothetical protein